MADSRTSSIPSPPPRVESGLTLTKSPLAETKISAVTTGRSQPYEWTCLPGDSVERGVRQTNKQDNTKACSLTPSHPNPKDKDLADIDAPRQKDFYLPPPPPPAPNVASCCALK